MASLRIPRLAALWAIAAIVTASSLVSFAESYRGLFLWSEHHGLSGTWSAVFPLMIDSFILVGELALFVALVDQWPVNSRYAAWAVTGVGLAISVAGNVGHVTSDALSFRVTAGIPPLAAAASLSVGLGVLKRIVEYAATREDAFSSDDSDFAPATAESAARAALRRSVMGGNALSKNQLQERFKLTRAEAGKVIAAVSAESNGHAPDD
jgi:hypothetical protein